MAELTLKAEKRKVSTQGALKQIRKNAKVPGIYYATDSAPMPITVEENELNKFVYTKEAHIAMFEIDGQEPLRAIVKEVQFDPLSDKIIHFDLLGMTAGQTLQLEIPVALEGQPKGVREGGVLQQFMYKLDVECLPKNIPDQITLDVSDLGIGDSILVRDLSFEDFNILNADTVMVVSVAKARGVEETEAVEGEEPGDAAATESEGEQKESSKE